MEKRTPPVSQCFLGPQLEDERRHSYLHLRMEKRNILLEGALVYALQRVSRQLVLFILAQLSQVAVLVLIPNGRVRLRLIALLHVPGVVQNGVFAVAKIYAA